MTSYFSLIPNGWFDYKKIQNTARQILILTGASGEQIYFMLNIIARNCNINNLDDKIAMIKTPTGNIVIYTPRSERNDTGPALTIINEVDVMDLAEKINKEKLPINIVVDKKSMTIKILFDWKSHQQTTPTLLH